MDGSLWEGRSILRSAGTHVGKDFQLVLERSQLGNDFILSSDFQQEGNGTHHLLVDWLVGSQQVGMFGERYFAQLVNMLVYQKVGYQIG